MYKNPNYIYGPSDRLVSANLHFGEYILSKLKEHSGKIALINGATHQELSYDEIAQKAMNIAVSLTRMGVKKGDVIAISSENRNEFWSTVIGICCTGAVVTTINIGYTNDELKHVMSISKPKYLFCSPVVYKTHQKIYNSVKYLKKVFLFGDERQPNTILYNEVAVAGSSNAGGVTSNVNYEEFEPVEVEGQNDVVFILYSSGTTGLPKGVMLTHLSVLAFCSQREFVLPSLVTLTITPWFHTMGLISNLAAFTRGILGVYLPKFEVDLYLKTIEKYKVQQLAVVPAVLVALSKSNLNYDTSSLLFILCGAAPLYEDTAKAAKQRFPSVLALLQVYGMTETTLGIAVNVNPDKIDSVGTVTSHTVIKIVNPETGEVLGPHKEGEICIKSIFLMKGYIGKDRRADFDNEGFFRTGDIGYYDEDGYFYIVDRLKELIKYNAYQVAPAEIEAVLLRHPDIRDAGVVGVPHASAGEAPLAFVALRPGAALSARDVQDYVAERLSNPKHLRGGVKFVDEIPRNQTGKILRKELRKMVKNGRSKL